MKKFMIFVLMWPLLILSGCNDEKTSNSIKFAVSAEYPPFEYYADGEITGFDIELAKLIAKELQLEVVFENMEFSTILAALNNGSVDAAISTITITKEREKTFSFSTPYYTESLAMVFPQDKPLIDQAQFAGKKIACQLGTTMEIWLKRHCPNTKIITMDNSNQVIEAIKAGHVDGAMLDSIQGAAFSKRNPSLSYAIITKSDTGYGIAFPQHSALTLQVNKALLVLEANGSLEKLQQKWLGDLTWQH